jgi:hypothetical protein
LLSPELPLPWGVGGAVAANLGVGVRRRSSAKDQFEVSGVAERLSAYDIAVPDVEASGSEDSQLVDRAATLLAVMPCNQHRHTIEELVSPHDPERGRRAVDALIAAAVATEDDAGHLRRLG